MKQTKAIIVGGGIGGLATAIAFDKIGWDYIVLEQAPKIKEVGSGISIWSNGIYCLKELGIEKKFYEKAIPNKGFSIQSHQGKIIKQHVFSNSNGQSKISVSTIYRPDLINILLQAVPSQKVFLNSKVQSFSKDSENITVKLTSGEQVKGDILIGADGIHSTIRKNLMDNRKPRYAGYTCWRGLVAMNQKTPLEQEGILGMGPDSLCGFAGLKNNKIFWFAASSSPPDLSKELKIEHLKKTFSLWIHPIKEIINQTPLNSIIRNDIMDLPPIKEWGQGLCTLLGDAAHAATPNLAQGACMALEDSVELAYLLSKYADDKEKALRLFEKQRYARTADLVRDSRWVGVMSQWCHPLLIKIRNSIGYQIFSNLGLNKYAGYRVSSLS